MAQSLKLNKILDSNGKCVLVTVKDGTTLIANISSCDDDGFKEMTDNFTSLIGPEMEMLEEEG